MDIKHRTASNGRFTMEIRQRIAQGYEASTAKNAFIRLMYK